MSTPLIEFLDALGRQPQAADFDVRVAALAVDTPVREALLGRDANALARAYGDHRMMWCGIMVPEDEPAPRKDCPDEHEQPEREPDEPPSREST